MLQAHCASGAVVKKGQMKRGAPNESSRRDMKRARGGKEQTIDSQFYHKNSLAHLFPYKTHEQALKAVSDQCTPEPVAAAHPWEKASTLLREGGTQ